MDEFKEKNKELQAKGYDILHKKLLDEKKAEDLMVKAAAANSLDAQRWLANAYMKGDGVAKDAAKAKSYFEASIAGGDLNSINDYALALVDGDLGTKEEAQGLEMMRKAADAGNEYALWNMGRFAEAGTGMAKDMDSAVDFYRKAAESAIASSTCRRMRST